MADLRPPLDSLFGGDLGETGVLTPFGGAPLAGVQAVRGSAGNVFPSEGSALAVAERRTVFRFRRDRVPNLPTGSTFAASDRTWTVDTILADDGEVVEALVR